MTNTETPIEVTRDACLVWLQNNCGAGLPYGEATGLKDALHGTAYVLRQIESSPRYEVNIGQCVSATTSLRWLLEYVARNELTTEAQSAEIARLRAENERLQADGIHTCSDTCQRHTCVLRREIERLREALNEASGIINTVALTDEYGDIDADQSAIINAQQRIKAALAGESA